MSEQAPKKTNPRGDFVQTENGFFIPKNFSSQREMDRYIDREARQEGYSYNSLRNTEADKIDLINEKNEQAYDDILDPRNVIEFKELIDTSIQRGEDEIYQPTGVRKDMDGSQLKSQLSRSQSIRYNLIDSYEELESQIENSEKNTNDIPAKDTEPVYIKVRKESNSSEATTEDSVKAESAQKDPLDFEPEEVILPTDQPTQAIVRVSPKETTVPTSETSLEIVKINPEEDLKKARQEFIDAKIAVETSYFTKWFGGAKKHQRLEVAKLDLYEQEILEMTRQFYREHSIEDDSDEARMLVATQAYNMMAEIDKMANDSYKVMIAEKEKSRFYRVATKVGNWFTKGSKVKQWAKGAGTGLVLGAATSVGTTVLGVGWPITTAIGLATGAAVGYTSKQSVIKQRVEQLDDEDEKLVKMHSRLDDARKVLEDTSDAAENVGRRAFAQLLDSEQEKTLENQSNLRKGIKEAMGRYSLGFALGGVLGHGLLGPDATIGATDNSPTGGSEQAIGPDGGSGAEPDVTESRVGAAPEDLVGYGGSTNQFIEINTNGAPEHAVAELLGQGPYEASSTFSRLVNEIGMDNIFVDDLGQAVDMSQFGGDIGVGYQPWDTNMNIKFSDEALRQIASWQ